MIRVFFLFNNNLQLFFRFDEGERFSFISCALSLSFSSSGCGLLPPPRLEGDSAGLHFTSFSVTKGSFVLMVPTSSMGGRAAGVLQVSELHGRNMNLNLLQ